MAAHPNPTEDEIRESAAIVEQFLRRRDEQIAFAGAQFALLLAQLPALVLGLLSGLLFRGGMVLRWFGIAVVTENGMEVSRSRALWRSVIAWSPCAAFNVITPLLLFLSPSLSPSLLVPTAGMLLVVVSLIGIVAAAVTPARGLQDRLAGTYLVPR
jgi:hypothetical protein